jgi:hypothetical protein
MRIEVENDDGSWSVLNRSLPGQDPREIALMADRWRALNMFAGARVRIVDTRAGEAP